MRLCFKCFCWTKSDLKILTNIITEIKLFCHCVLRCLRSSKIEKNLYSTGEYFGDYFNSMKIIFTDLVREWMVNYCLLRFIHKFKQIYQRGLNIVTKSWYVNNFIEFHKVYALLITIFPWNKINFLMKFISSWFLIYLSRKFCFQIFITTQKS